MKKFVLAAALAFGAIAVAPALADKYAGCYVDYYQGGVWYFNCTGADFAKALAEFKHQNPQFVVSAMTGDGNGGYGRDRGYFISTEPRKQ